jgi:hypothetical protein
MVRQIFIPVVLNARNRSLFSENGVDNGIRYDYCAGLCLSANVHCGHDVEARFEPIFAATDGVVKFAGFDGFYTPNHVDIEPIVGPFRGEYHIYGHLSEAHVATGQRVQRGQQIGITGTNCVDSQCSALAIGNEHLHWERRGVPGFSGCSLDPDPVLTSANANGEGGGEVEEDDDTGDTGGGGDGEMGGPFRRKDRIGVADGPLRLRKGPGKDFRVLQDLPNGTRLCVTGEPERADGREWYPVLVNNVHRPGWVAGDHCRLLARRGCAGGQETLELPVPEGAAQPGQPISPHPDSGPSTSDREGITEALPTVEYDAEGVFVGVTFPSPEAVAELAEGAGAASESRPWAKG